MATWNIISHENSSRCQVVNVQDITLKIGRFITSLKISTANSKPRNLAQW
jgi:hypothetical protein